MAASNIKNCIRIFRLNPNLVSSRQRSGGAPSCIQYLQQSRFTSEIVQGIRRNWLTPCRSSISIPPPANSSGTTSATLGMYVCMRGQGLNARCVQRPKDEAYRSVQSFHARAANCEFVSIHGDQSPVNAFAFDPFPCEGARHRIFAVYLRS
ncbi:hypothetical protein HNY73_021261 [Argiope bruennichi]|uniref:Uncharacterized protein n=1 Tax=Argiope bruennichi TaxID=94029 RepID=A0A8T0EAR5_ARGBR|nr:hypothetical protein HNY73_021261 [Argiope bruennichi]